jgi:hypothetical protein
VDAIRHLSDAVMRSSIKDDQKRDVLGVIEIITKQAEAKPEARSKGTVQARLAGLPSVLKVAGELTTLWDKYGPIIRAHFGF